MKARNLSPKTIKLYRDAANDFLRHLAAAGGPDAPENLRREHVEGFVVAMQDRGLSPSTESLVCRDLQQSCKWLAEEEEIAADPMARMSPPVVPEVFLDTGARLSEIANLGVDDIALGRDTNLARVVGKGRRPRDLPFGSKTTQALDRYLRVRVRHSQAGLPSLWLGSRSGAMSSSGVYQVLRRRAREAGLPPLHPHQFRHTFAHTWQVGGVAVDASFGRCRDRYGVGVLGPAGCWMWAVRRL